VESDSGKTLTRESFLETAGRYPFGMYRESAQKVVRDPIAVDESGALVCVGEVPENTTLAIMKGTPENLISAARLACDEALAVENGNCPVDPQTQVWVADCISRALFLGKDFSSELGIINDQARSAGITSPIKGALTLGEISSHGHGVLEYLNKTIVVGGFSER